MAWCQQPGCGAEITWAMTPNDRRIPIDVGTKENGNIVFEAGLAVVLKKDDPRLADELVPRWTAHWASCKNPPTRKPKTKESA